LPAAAWWAILYEVSLLMTITTVRVLRVASIWRRLLHVIL
jgi:hypothetical protein